MPLGAAYTPTNIVVTTSNSMPVLCISCPWFRQSGPSYLVCVIEGEILQVSEYFSLAVMRESFPRDVVR